jgi:hypothetical protein
LKCTATSGTGHRPLHGGRIVPERIAWQRGHNLGQLQLTMRNVKCQT